MMIVIHNVSVIQRSFILLSCTLYVGLGCIQHIAVMGDLLIVHFQTVLSESNQNAKPFENHYQKEWSDPMT